MDKKEYARQYYIRNAEEVKRKAREYRANNLAQVTLQKKKHYAENVEKVQATIAAYYQKNKAAISAYKLAWSRANREQTNATKRNWAEANPEKRKQAALVWAKANPAKCCAVRMRRIAKKRNATPAWADLRYIELFYIFAKEEEKRLGVKVHVDHIIPLSHPLVCGLHNEFNLQLLTATENSRKNNHFEVI